MKPICDINQLVRDLMEHERECFQKYKHGHSSFDNTPAKRRWEDAKALLESIVNFAQTLAATEPEV